MEVENMELLKKFFGLIFRPKQTINDLQPVDREIIGLVIFALIVKGHQGLVDLPILYSNMSIAPFATALNNIVGVLLYLGGMTFYLNRIACPPDKRGEPGDLFRHLSYGLVPYIIANLISTLLFFYGPTLLPSLGQLQNMILRIIVEEVGLLLGLRGIVSYYSFIKTQSVTPMRAFIALLVINVIYILFNALPFLISGPYSY
jgi:hypothetical protein